MELCRSFLDRWNRQPCDEIEQEIYEKDCSDETRRSEYNSTIRQFNAWCVAEDAVDSEWLSYYGSNLTTNYFYAEEILYTLHRKKPAELDSVHWKFDLYYQIGLVRGLDKLMPANDSRIIYVRKCQDFDLLTARLFWRCPNQRITPILYRNLDISNIQNAFNTVIKKRRLQL